jgi:hypothetical protein
MTYEALKYHPLAIPFSYLTVPGTNVEAVHRALNQLSVKNGVIRCSGLNTPKMGYNWKIIAKVAGSEIKDDLCLVSFEK